MNVILYGAANPDIVKLVFNTKDMYLKGFIDDIKNGWFMGRPILGNKSAIKNFTDDYYFINAVSSSCKNRMVVQENLNKYKVRMVNLISNDIDLSFVKKGTGIIIYPGVRVGGLTEIGDYTVVRYNSVVGHDNTIGAYNIINHNVTTCGHVNTKDGVYLGSGCVIREHTNIAQSSIVGAGAVVLNNVESGKVVVGIPAKSL